MFVSYNWSYFRHKWLKYLILKNVIRQGHNDLELIFH